MTSRRSSRSGAVCSAVLALAVSTPALGFWLTGHAQAGNRAVAGSGEHHRYDGGTTDGSGTSDGGQGDDAPQPSQPEQSEQPLLEVPQVDPPLPPTPVPPVPVPVPPPVSPPPATGPLPVPLPSLSDLELAPAVVEMSLLCDAAPAAEGTPTAVPSAEPCPAPTAPLLDTPVPSLDRGAVGGPAPALPGSGPDELPQDVTNP